MDSTLLIMIASFGAAMALVFGISSWIQSKQDSQAESRLAAFTGKSKATSGQIADELVRDGLSSATGILGAIAARFKNLPMFFQQAESPLKPDQFLILVACTGALGAAICAFVPRIPNTLIPVGGFTGFALPWLWLWFKRRMRFKKFESQLADALELMARALKSGHSLGSGLQVVAGEMPDPIATEFLKVHEEQNLGMSIEAALKSLLKRVPNMDLQFFVTAVCIQRQCGGDLAEILTKIGGLVRERFKILGQVKALTGEGRISGVVLMGLPPCLFAAVYSLNPEYVMVLFDREEGRKMLFVTGVLQVLGAVCIKKIIDIKV